MCVYVVGGGERGEGKERRKWEERRGEGRQDTSSRIVGRYLLIPTLLMVKENILSKVELDMPRSSA